MAYFKKSCRQDPDKAVALGIQLAVEFADKGNKARSALWFEKVYDLRPSYETALKLATIYREDFQDAETAVNWFECAYLHRPSGSLALGIGLIYANELDEPEKAVLWLKRSFDQMPTVETAGKLAQIYRYELGDDESAKAWSDNLFRVRHGRNTVEPAPVAGHQLADILPQALVQK